MLHIMRKFKNMPIINWSRYQNKADDFIGHSFLNLSEINKAWIFKKIFSNQLQKCISALRKKIVISNATLCINCVLMILVMIL